VKQGFIEEADLDCVLVGQQLLKTGDITVVQFQTVMIERSATGLDIGEMLLAKGYVNEFMLERAYRNQSEDTLVKVPAVLAVGQHTTIEFKPHPEHAVEPPPQAQTEPEPSEEEKTAAEEQAYAANMETGEYAAAVAPTVESPVAAQAPEVVAEQVVLRPPAADAESAEAGPSLVEKVEAARATLSDTNFITERTLKISNAAPAWKDQLDWSSPDSSEEEAAPAAETQEPAESSEPGAEPAAPAAAPPHVMAPLTPDTLADSVRAIAQIWAEDVSPANSWARLETPAPQGVIQPEIHHDLELDTTGPLSAVEDDPSESLITGDNPFVAGDSVEEMPAPDSVSPEPAATESAAQDASASDDVVSEIETSSQLPSLIELEARAQKKDRQSEPDKLKLEPKRATGDWQIMSVPGSALTSLFLGEEAPTPPNAFITESREDQYQTGPQRVHSGEAEVGQEQSPPQSEETTSPAPQSNTTQPAAPPKGEDAPPDGESRRGRRRRTRS
ncbi:MAG: hypothetical protein JST01_02610, partial [Cyanobacteria bacterium SZAS TMP-1]|nr:hypothetical protein [Cyanobacteria bacterium SZAS TMP-1]